MSNTSDDCDIVADFDFDDDMIEDDRIGWKKENEVLGIIERIKRRIQIKVVVVVVVFVIKLFCCIEQKEYIVVFVCRMNPNMISLTLFNLLFFLLLHTQKK